MLRTKLPLATSAAVLLSLCGAALARPLDQPAKPAQSAGTSTDAKEAQLRALRELAARNIARIAFSDLSLQDEPVADDHRLTSQLLSIAYDLWPKEQLLRWRLGAESAADDRDSSIELCRQLLRLDPTDTVVQYRMITLLLEEAHTAEAKLARLRRLIGPEGNRFDASVRSRLCMDAAGVCQQLGDDAGFAGYVKQATVLDASNRDAAAAAAAYFAERVDDPIGRLELLANLLLAEPADPETQMAIGRELSALGAFKEALRFQENVIRMLEVAQSGTPPQFARDRLYSRWGSQSPQVVVDEINAQVSAYRERARRQIEEMEKDLLARAEVPKPEDVRLEILMERLRLIAAVTAGDKKTVQASVHDLRATIAGRVAELADPKRRPAEIDEAQAAEITRQMLIGAVTLISWVDHYEAPAPIPDPANPAAAAATTPAPKPAEAPPAAPATPADQPAEPAAPAAEPPEQPFPAEALLTELDDITAKYGVPADDLDLLTARGWVLVRASRLDEAQPLLEKVGDQRVEAQLGLAQLYSARNDPARAEEYYRLVWRGVPQSLEAMYAYSMLRTILGREDVEPQLVRRARGFAEGIPAWIDKIADGGHTFMSLEVEALPTTTPALEPTTIKIRLRNLAPVPLGLGADRTLNSQILVGSSMEIGLSNIKAYLTPEATSIARRLRLMPNESVSIEYWPDAGSAGWVIDECCDRMIRQRWRAVQGFSRSEEGVIATGALCLSRDSGSQVRVGVEQAKLSTAEFIEKLKTADVKELGAVASVLRARLLNPMTDQSGLTRDLVAQDKNAIAAAAAARYPSLPTEGRMIFVSILPQSSIVEEMKPLDEVVRTETDPAIAAIVLTSRVTDAADPFLVACTASSDARLAKIATILETRLKAGGSGLAARGGPDVHGIIKDSIAAQTIDKTGLGGPGSAGR